MHYTYYIQYIKMHNNCTMFCQAGLLPGTPIQGRLIRKGSFFIQQPAQRNNKSFHLKICEAIHAWDYQQAYNRHIEYCF